MPHYKLVYFKSRGRAEVARYLFALAKVHFVDVQVDREEWPKIKPGTPYGILPVLDVDGVQYCQSNAINRFLAREFGFYGSTSAEAFRIDMVADCLSDALSDLVTCLWVLQGEAKEKAKEQLANETLPKLTKFVEHELGSKQWIVGHKVSVADLGVVEFFDNAVPKMFPGDQWKCLSEKILALVGRVKAIPEIAAYVAKRAATE